MATATQLSGLDPGVRRRFSGISTLIGNTPLLALDVELRGYDAFKRVCNTCCDLDECAALPPEGFTGECELPDCPRSRHGRTA